MNISTNAIEIYKTKDERVELDVRLDKETVWLTQKQMAELFERDTDTIGLHIKNIYNEGELEEQGTTEKSSVVQVEGGRNVRRDLNTYNLDVIISVGYRVKSQRGTDFRKWATSRLKEYIVRGYALNIKRLETQQEKMEELLGFVDNMKNQVGLPESKGLLKIISDYYKALLLLDDYDKGTVAQKNEKKEQHRLTLEEAYAVVESLKKKFMEEKLFGHEKDRSFESAILSTYQTFGGEELYTSV